MDIKAPDVKILRERTGAGMLDCKKALVEAGGDFKKAEKLLKELGLAAAAKRSGRATNEGRIFSRIKNSKGCLVELACETDFVARNREFIALGEDIADTVINKNLSAISPELKDAVNSVLSRIKENIILRRFKTVLAGSDELLIDYLHGEGKIGVIVKIKAEKPELLNNERVKTFAFDCALHIAAFNPKFHSKAMVDPAYLKEQEEIFTKQTESLGKPENVRTGIVKGKMNKHLSEICFVNQPFVKDEKKSVQQVADSLSKDVGGTIEITDYLYFRVGEEL
ncbi:MAG: translation elongation factor Ts [Spirochaetota bacterium]